MSHYPPARGPRWTALLHLVRGFSDEYPARGGPTPAVGAGTGVLRPERPATLGAPTLTFAEEHAPLCSTTIEHLPPLAASDGRVGNFVVRAASVTGRLHARTGRSREDDYAVTAMNGDSVTAAVADGVGDPGARNSAIGAQVAVRETCALLSQRPTPASADEARAFCSQLSASMLTAATRLLNRAVQPTDLATTLVVVTVRPDGIYTGFAVGDSGVAIHENQNWDIVLGRHAGLLNDAGSTLPRDNPSVEMYAGRLQPGQALLLGTDGLFIPLEAAEVNLELAARWKHPPTLLAFIGDLCFERRGEADDRTAVCIWYLPEGSAG